MGNESFGNKLETERRSSPGMRKRSDRTRLLLVLLIFTNCPKASATSTTSSVSSQLQSQLSSSTSSSSSPASSASSSPSSASSTLLPTTTKDPPHTLATSTTTSWNVTCPSNCECTMRVSTLSERLLKTVVCSDRKLKTVPRFPPIDTESLVLNGNLIYDFHDYFIDLAQLKELDLTDNKIKYLGRGYIFHNLSGLQYLSLSKNDISSIEKDVFNGLANLKMLVLSGNKISYIEDQAFHGLSLLNILDLSKNQLSALYPEWFYGLANLNELHVFENQIHHLTAAVFRSLRSLTHLSLFGNRISEVSDEAFSGLDKLESLHLQRNSLADIPTKALRQLPKLSMLLMSRNPFVRLRRYSFTSLPVQELFLNNLPELRIIEASSIDGLPNLTTLNMQDCPKLSFVDSKAFVNVSSLKTLHFENCRLLGINKDLLDSLTKKSKSRLQKAEISTIELGLGNNPLQCDCNIRWMVQNLRSNKSSIRLLDADKLRCEHRQGRRLLDLDYASIPTTCPPTIVPIQDERFERRLGDGLYLDCRALGKPPPILWWTTPTGRVINSTINDGRYQLRQPGTLFFHHIKLTDAGNYTCSAENFQGTTESTVNLKVRRIDIHLFSTGTSSTFVTLVWNGTERNTYNKFQLLYRLVANTEGVSSADDSANVTGANNHQYDHVTASPFHRTHTITRLIPDSVYEFCIAYEDSDGALVQISCTTARTHNAEYMLGGIRRTSNVAVAIVLAIVAVMIIVICCVTVVARKYRQRHYVCPDKPNAHYMSQIPLENLYSPLMSNIGQ